MSAALSEVTAASLNRAKVAELRYWIDKVNEGQPKKKKVLTKVGGKDVLRKRLADHYGLDLSEIPPAASKKGPVTIDKHIQEQQWDHLLGLHEEWKQAAAEGRKFMLVLQGTNTGEISLEIKSEKVLTCRK